MASLPQQLALRALRPPAHDVIPREAWNQVVQELGDLVVAHSSTKRLRGRACVVFVPVPENVDRVSARLRELLGMDDPWEQNPDWWKQ